LGATRANLLSLAVVSAWRLGLMIRAVSVTTKASPKEASWLVLAFADGVAMIAVIFSPVPIFEHMGGIQRPPSDELIKSLGGTVFTFAMPLAGVLGTGLIIMLTHKGMDPWELPGQSASRVISTGKAAMFFALGAVVIWIPLLCLTQPEQL